MHHRTLDLSIELSCGQQLNRMKPRYYMTQNAKPISVSRSVIFVIEIEL